MVSWDKCTKWPLNMCWINWLRGCIEGRVVKHVLGQVDAEGGFPKTEKTSSFIPSMGKLKTVCYLPKPSQNWLKMHSLLICPWSWIQIRFSLLFIFIFILHLLKGLESSSILYFTLQIKLFALLKLKEYYEIFSSSHLNRLLS